MQRRKAGAIVTAGILATVVAGVIAQARNGAHAPSATGAELESAARRVLEATGGEWASIGPSSGSGTWEATVVRTDLSKVSVTLNDKFQIMRVMSESEARRRDPRMHASVPDPAAEPVYMLAQAPAPPSPERAAGERDDDD